MPSLHLPCLSLWPLHTPGSLWQWVPQVCSPVLKLSLSNWMSFVASYVSILGEMASNWCHGNQCIFTLFRLLKIRLVYSLLFVFSKLRCPWVPSSLYRCALFLLAFSDLTIYFLKWDQSCGTIQNVDESWIYSKAQCLLLFYFYSFLKIHNSLFGALTDNEHWPNYFLDLLYTLTAELLSVQKRFTYILN